MKTPFISAKFHYKASEISCIFHYIFGVYCICYTKVIMHIVMWLKIFITYTSGYVVKCVIVLKILQYWQYYDIDIVTVLEILQYCQITYWQYYSTEILQYWNYCSTDNITILEILQYWKYYSIENSKLLKILQSLQYYSIDSITVMIILQCLPNISYYLYSNALLAWMRFELTTTNLVSTYSTCHVVIMINVTL